MRPPVGIIVCIGTESLGNVKQEQTTWVFEAGQTLISHVISMQSAHCRLPDTERET